MSTRLSRLPHSLRFLVIASLGLCGLFAFGCTAPTRVVERRVERARQRSEERIFVLSPELAAARGYKSTEADTVTTAQAPSPTPATAEVLLAPEVHAYPVSRYVDPADPDLLHEAHLVYRREAGSRWKLSSSPYVPVTKGPKAAIQGAGPDAIQAAELTALLIELQKADLQSREAIELLSKALESLSARLDQTPTQKAADRGGREASPN